MTTDTLLGSPQFPAVPTGIPSSTREAMDVAVRILQSRKDAWVSTPVSKRLKLLDRMMKDSAAIACRWVDMSREAKGMPANAATADEWSVGPYAVLRNLRGLRRSLGDINRYGSPRISDSIVTRPDGQVVARIFPQTVYDRIFLGGLTAEVWMEPGVTSAELPKTQALAYQDKHHEGKVALVLGAGNYLAIPAMDILYKLFVEDHVVLLKPNPVNAQLGSLIEECFQALVEQGFLRIVYGGAAEGAYLCNHAGVDEIHITGSDKSFDAIVFGSGPEGARRKRERNPLLTKPITAELGNVTPAIIVPGPWSFNDLTYQAEHIITMLTENAGFNCVTTRVILQHASWKQRGQLLEEIRRLLSRAPLRTAYYPGARDRHRAFVSAHPEAELYGKPTEEQLPWTLIPGVDPKNKDDITFTTEAFCSLFAETPIKAETVPEYIERAVEFANKHLWGTLAATLIVHPSSLKDPGVAAAVERAIADLRYGTIGVNYWAAAAYSMAITPWGAFPGHTIDNIQSGIGVVHNTFMFSRSQKTVLRAPFRIRPVPIWFETRTKRGWKVFPKLVQFEASPSIWKVPAIVWAALRG
jgi:acyl-CoA reductase-like NAD-dependent aldehyde dehydrogenase